MSIICSKNWTDTYFKLDTGEIKTCCQIEPLAYLAADELNDDNFTDLTKHHSIVEVKKEFISGNLPKQCQKTCSFSDPSSTLLTQNLWLNKKFSQHEKEILLDINYVSNIEISLGTVCNMTCIYCGPENSSEWEKLRNFKRIPIMQENLQAKYIEKLYKFVKEHIVTNNKKNILYKIRGGEPLLYLEMYEIIETISELHVGDKKQITFSIISNLNVKEKLISRLIEFTFKYPSIKFIVSPSIDGVDSITIEQRDGLDFELFNRNIQALKQSNVIISFLPTISNIGLESLFSLYDYIENNFNIHDYMKKWSILFNMVKLPKELYIGTLPNKYCNVVDDINKKFNEWVKIEPLLLGSHHFKSISKIKPLIGSQRNEKTVNDIRIFFVKQGKLKNKNYFEIFPHLNEICDPNIK